MPIPVIFYFCVLIKLCMKKMSLNNLFDLLYNELFAKIAQCKFDITHYFKQLFKYNSRFGTQSAPQAKHRSIPSKDKNFFVKKLPN